MLTRFGRRHSWRSAVPRAHCRAMGTLHRGYEAFGSFHTPSTASLFAGAMPPDLPDPHSFLPPLSSTDMLVLAPTADDPGIARNRELFTIDFEQWTYLNHGAFGGPTRYATRVAAAWREFAEQQPLVFNDRLLFPYVVQSIQALARVLQIADAQELVLLPNATTGLHAVLDSVLRNSDEDPGDDVVVCFSTRYGAVRKMLQSLDTPSRRRKLRVHEKPLSLDESYDDQIVLDKLERALDGISRQAAGSRVPLVIVDHITSNTGVLLPVSEIVQLCHVRGIAVLVDGAHGLFNLPLDLDALHADYYVGNCHKWFASPKGAAFLHVNKRTGVQQTRTTEILPRVVSHGFFDGYQSAFMWTGLQDYAPWLSLPRCIAFWNLLDVARCRQYMHALLQEAVELLYSTWGMDQQLARARQFPVHKRHAMRLVQLPPRTVFGVDCSGGRSTSSDAKHIQDALHVAHRIEVPVKCVDGKLFVRLSAHVYNRIADYDRLAQVILSS